MVGREEISCWIMDGWSSGQLSGFITGGRGEGEESWVKNLEKAELRIFALSCSVEADKEEVLRGIIEDSLF